MLAGPITLEEYNAIRVHLTYMLDTAETAASRLKPAVKGDDSGWVMKQYKYWENVAAGYRLALDRAAKRLEKPNNVAG